MARAALRPESHRVACAMIPHFALRLELLRRPELAGLPLVLASAPGQRPVVDDCSDEARAQGVRPGMPLRQVVGVCRDAALLVPDAAYYARAFDALLTAWERVSPAVEPAGPGIAYLGLAGMQPVYPHLRELYAAIREAAAEALAAATGATAGDPPGSGAAGSPRPAIAPHIGVGPNKFVARMAALRAWPDAPRAVGDPAEAGALLAPLPVRHLPADPEAQRRLELMGIRTLGDLARLPRAAVQAQFGFAGGRWWDLACGRDDEPVLPRRPPEQVAEAIAFPAPVIDVAVLRVAAEQLVARALARPDMRGRGVRRLRLSAALEGRQSWEKTVVLKESTGDAARLRAALLPHLEGLALPAAAEELRLELLELAGAHAKQAALDTVFGGRRAELAEAVAQLRARYGQSPLYKVVALEPASRIPERRHGLIRFDP